jgi:putative copper export protein
MTAMSAAEASPSGLGWPPPPAATTPPPSPLATAGRWLLYCGLALLVGAAATGLAVYDRRLPAGARPLLWVGAGLAVVGLVARVAAEQTAVAASLADLVASDTGHNLAWLAAGVLASATAAGLLAARIRQPDGPNRAAMADDSHARPSAGVGRGWLAGLLSHPHRRRPSQPETTTGSVMVDRVQAVTRFSRLALPVVGVLAVTGLNRALDLAGGWSGLLETGFGQVLDLKVLLFAALLVLAARNRYLLLPDLAGPYGHGRLGPLRRSLTAEVGLVAAVLPAAALRTQLPPGKFATATATATARPSPPANVQVQGSDVTT